MPRAKRYDDASGKWVYADEAGRGEKGNGIKSAVLNADYTLTLTFDDGTSYTTPSIRGATGSAGKDGSNGSNGKDGTSVTVTNVSESAADGGSNVVTFSDGKTLTVKNGSKGSTGPAYTLTTADKTAIANQVKDSFTTETWTFTLEDGSTVNKAVLLG